MGVPAIFWLTGSADSVPLSTDWLTPEELRYYSRFKFPKRQNDWKLGRWVAKNALRRFLRLSGEMVEYNDLSIGTKDNGAPEVLAHTAHRVCSISLSHCQSVGFCVIHSQEGDIGCDVEKIEDRADSFINDFFTPQEQSQILNANPNLRPLLNTLFWSAKESALKLLGKGLNLDTRKVIVSCSDYDQQSLDWSELTVDYVDGNCKFDGFWKAEEQYIYTIVSKRGSPFPANLKE